MGASSETIPEDWSAAQRAVWEREETYWKLVQAADVDGFLDLLDERFIGWPGGAETPVPFADFRPYVRGWFRDVSEAEFRYSLTPHAVAVVGDVGISHYHAHSSYGDEAEVRESRITHTWRRGGSGWKIIGGMGSRSSGR